MVIGFDTCRHIIISDWIYSAQTNKEKIEQYYIAKKGHKRDSTVVCNEINTLEHDIDTNQVRGNCLDCARTLLWNDINVLCNHGVQHSRNPLAMILKIYFCKNG